MGAVNFRGPPRFWKMAGRHYVGYSRLREPLHKIFVLDSALDEIHVDCRVRKEMDRLRIATKVSIFEVPELIDMSTGFTLVMHNCRGLQHHLLDIDADQNMQRASVLVLTETKIKRPVCCRGLSLTNFTLLDGSSSGYSGLSDVEMYKQSNSNGLEVTTCFRTYSNQIHLLYCLLKLHEFSSDYLHLVCLYRSPVSNNFSDLLDMLEMCLTRYEFSGHSAPCDRRLQCGFTKGLYSK